MNEKLKEAIETRIVPALLEDTRDQVDEAAVQADARREPMTIIFDREGYDRAFIKRLWEKYRIAVISYRKNVKDSWEEKEFKPYTVKVIGKPVTMVLAMKESQIDGFAVREVRKLSETGHQTAIITTHPSAGIKALDAGQVEAQSQLQQMRQSLEAQIATLLQQRASMPYHITVGQMAADERYTKLTSESTLFMNVIWMIVYRAETAVTTLVSRGILAARMKGECWSKRSLKVMPIYEPTMRTTH